MARNPQVSGLQGCWPSAQATQEPHLTPTRGLEAGCIVLSLTTRLTTAGAGSPGPARDDPSRAPLRAPEPLASPPHSGPYIRLVSSTGGRGRAGRLVEDRRGGLAEAVRGDPGQRVLASGLAELPAYVGRVADPPPHGRACAAASLAARRTSSHALCFPRNARSERQRVRAVGRSRRPDSSRRSRSPAAPAHWACG